MVREQEKRGHWLEGHMHECEVGDIANVLEWDPPNGQQLVILGLEEMHRPVHLGGDRAEVYVLLEQYKRK